MDSSPLLIAPVYNETLITYSGFTRPHAVEEQVQHFETRFGCLIDKACGEVKGRIEPHIFLSRVTYLPVSARSQHQSFIKKNLINIPPPVTFESIWSILNLYWDFLNYGLLEHVINKCGSDDLKKQMQDYVDELSTFKQTTRLCDFIESWPCRDDRPPEDRLKKVVVKMRHEWSQCTLQDVESFKRTLVHKFFLPEFDILLHSLHSVSHGSPLPPLPHYCSRTWQTLRQSSSKNMASMQSPLMARISTSPLSKSTVAT